MRSWEPGKVRDAQEVLIPVMVGAPSPGRDWVLLRLLPSEANLDVGHAPQLRLVVVDRVGRPTLCTTLARRLGWALAATLGSGFDGERLAVEQAPRPCVDDVDDSCLGVLGCVVYRVCASVGLVVPEVESPRFVDGIRHGAHGAFNLLRSMADGVSDRDVLRALDSREPCMRLARTFLLPPRADTTEEAAPPEGIRAAAPGREESTTDGHLRVVTWNIASALGERKSGESPSSWTPADNLHAIEAELLRWRAELVALQECPTREPLTDLVEAAPHAGFVRLYARRGHLVEAIGVAPGALQVGELTVRDLDLCVFRVIRGFLRVCCACRVMRRMAVDNDC